MTQKTPIEWTEMSANPIRARLKADRSKVGHYCEKVNLGCTNCYASRMQRRFGLPMFGSGQHRDKVELFLDETVLERIRKRRTPTVWFLCDMTDLFGEFVNAEWIAAILRVVDDCPQHTFQLLTKRPERIREHWSPFEFGRSPAIRPNVHLGTSVSDQGTATQAIPELLKCRDLAPVLFLSCEPLVGSVDLQPWLWVHDYMGDPDVPGGMMPIVDPADNSPDWVIVGGESGPGSRPCRLK